MRRLVPTVVGVGLLLSGVGLAPAPSHAASKPVLTAAAPAVEEDARSGKARVRLILDRDPKSRVKVAWETQDGTAEAGEDYRQRSGDVVFDVGARKRTVTVPVIDDDVAEGKERLFVGLSPRGARVADQKIAVVISDDDGGGGGGLQVEVAGGRATSHTFDTQVSNDDPTLVGATMTTTGPDGTGYRLTVPDGALASETTVTMTPWRSASGTGVTGGRLVGVRLSPAGTEFLLPATLVVDPPGSDRVPAVTFTQEGDETHGYPVDLDPDRLVFRVMHFSDFYGHTGDGISIKIVDPAPSDPAQALASEIERILRDERDRQVEGAEPDPAVMERVAELLESYYDHVVAPMLAGIRTDCSQARAGNNQVLGLARQAALLSIMPDQQQTILEAVATGMENCLAEALEPCVDQTDAERMERIKVFWRQVLPDGWGRPRPWSARPGTRLREPPRRDHHDRRALAQGGQRVPDRGVLDADLPPEVREPGPRTGLVRRRTRRVDGHRQLPAEDLRPGAQCRVMSERTYSGSGTLHTTFAGQLDPETDRDEGIAELEYFLPWSDGNLGLVPVLDGEVVGDSQRTIYQSTDGECVSRTEEVGHVFMPSWGPGHSGAPGVVVDDAAGRGVDFDHTYSDDRSAPGDTNTYDLHIVGSLRPVRG